MILTVSEFRTLTNNDADSDTIIQSALDIYTSIIEDYCGQVFTADDYEDTYYSVDVDPVVLKRVNINSLTSITSGVETADVNDFDVDLEAGLIWHSGTWYGNDVVIAYNAGLAPPPVVKHVLATIAKGYLDGFTGGLNDFRPVTKETVYGVTAVSYDAGGQGRSYYAELQGFTTLLDKYKVVNV